MRKLNVPTILLNLGVAIGGLVTALPFFWMVASSFKTTEEIFNPASIVPKSFDLGSYTRLFSVWPFWNWYLNSALAALITTVAVLFVCSLAGFGFAKYRFRGRNPLFFILLGSSMIPFPILLIPLFIVVSRIGWTNSLAALTVPFIAPAVGIFLMRQYILSLPQELLDAARIDGSSEFRIYAQIVLPIVRPGLATLAIITFISSWNSFLWPLVVLRNDTAMTLPVGLATMLGGVQAGSAPPYGPAMAASTLVSIPAIVLFLLVQRQYIAGLTSGAVK